MSAVIKAKPVLPLAKAARDYLQARTARQDALAEALAKTQALADAEEALCTAIDASGDERVSGAFIDGVVLSMTEEWWDQKPGDRIAVIFAEAV